MKRRTRLERSKFKRAGYDFNSPLSRAIASKGRIKKVGKRTDSWLKVRAEFMAKQPNKVVCHYCAIVGKGLLRPKNKMTVDHKNGRAGKLLTDTDNFVIACYRCNQDKGSTGYDKYVATLQSKLQ